MKLRIVSALLSIMMYLGLFTQVRVLSGETLQPVRSARGAGWEERKITQPDGIPPGAHKRQDAPAFFQGEAPGEPNGYERTVTAFGGYVPNVDAVMAQRIAVTAAARRNRIPAGELSASPPRLLPYKLDAYGVRGARVHAPTWVVEVKSVGSRTIRELVLVDPEDGAVRGYFALPFRAAISQNLQ